MVSDWQGGDISKLFPALSGKEDLSMGEDKKEFGSILLQNMEAQKQLSDECIVDDQVEEAELVNQYMKTQAAATVDFRGEQLGTYGLLKHMQSTDRTERKAAFEAWAKLYAGMDLDVKYVKERSFWVDWKIIFKTFKVCLLGHGE